MALIVVTERMVVRQQDQGVDGANRPNGGFAIGAGSEANGGGDAYSEKYVIPDDSGLMAIIRVLYAGVRV